MKLYIIALLVTLFSISNVHANETESVKIGVPQWLGAKIIAQLLKEIIETRIGGEAELVPASNGEIFAAMDKGNGEIDVHPDVWLPNQETFTSKYVDQNGSVVLTDNFYVGIQTFCTSQKFAKENNINTIFDLANPEIAQKMDSNGDGKGEIWVGAPGWASTNINLIKMRDYDLLDVLEPEVIPQSDMYKKVKHSIERDMGFAFACYRPNEIWYQFDLKVLDEPAYDSATYKVLQPSDDPQWYENSSVSTQDPPKEMHMAYSKSIEDRAPGIVELLDNIKLDEEVISSLSYQVSNGKDIETVAQEWVGGNSQVIDEWLGL